VRYTQRAVAADKGSAFWDCMHLNKAGYAASADMLLFDLINEYEAWRNRRSSC
jgi:hypothetical protein